MARPQTNGVDYFPLDVMLDDNFKLLEAECGLRGFALVVKLYQKVYSVGCYCGFTQDVALLFARENGVGGSVVSEIINCALRRGIFDKEIFTNFSVLTSRGIQKRYFEMIKRRTKIEIDSRYLLVNCDSLPNNVTLRGVSVDNNEQNVYKNYTNKSKVNKSKVNESKVNTPAGAVCVYDKVNEIYQKFNQICTRLNPVNNLPNPTRERAAIYLLDHYTSEQIDTAFKNVNDSDFLCINKNGYSFGFDWIVKVENFVKALEGNYKNKSTKENKTSSYDLNDVEEMMMDNLPKW